MLPFTFIRKDGGVRLVAISPVGGLALMLYTGLGLCLGIMLRGILALYIDYIPPYPLLP